MELTSTPAPFRSRNNSKAFSFSAWFMTFQTRTFAPETVHSACSGGRFRLVVLTGRSTRTLPLRVTVRSFRAATAAPVNSIR